MFANEFKAAILCEIFCDAGEIVARVGDGFREGGRAGGVGGGDLGEVSCGVGEGLCLHERGLGAVAPGSHGGEHAAGEGRLGVGVGGGGWTAAAAPAVECDDRGVARVAAEDFSVGEIETDFPGLEVTRGRDFPGHGALF